MLDRLLTIYTSLPHHPGKGTIVNRLLAISPVETDLIRTCTRMGVRFECDLNDHVGRHIYYGIFERRDALRLSRLVRPGNVIVDAGANIGYYSLLFAKWLHGSGAVHAFEPFPDTVRRFLRNLELNPEFRRTVHLHELALSNCSGMVGMAEPDSANCGCNYISPASPGGIRAVTLDGFVREQGLTRLDLIKIDVEGAEVALLRGAEETLKRLRPVIMVEINPSTLRRFGQTAADIVSLLGSHRYRLTLTTRWGGVRPLTSLPVIGEPNVFAFPID